MTELQAIELIKDMRLCSFDIQNIYTNIPKIGIINIINTIIENNQEIDRIVQKEIIHIKNSARTKIIPRSTRNTINKPTG
jgi:ribosomal protein S20